MNEDSVDIDLLVEETASLQCFKDALELETCDERGDAVSQIQAAGKLVSMKVHALGFVKTVLSQMWGIPRGLKVTELDRNKFMFMFLFPSAKEKHRVLEKGPWSINRELLILKEAFMGSSCERNVRLSLVFMVVDQWERGGTAISKKGDSVAEEIGDTRLVSSAKVGERDILVISSPSRAPMHVPEITVNASPSSYGNEVIGKSGVGVISLEDSSVGDIQMMETDPIGQRRPQGVQTRTGRKFDFKYLGDLLDILIDHCCRPESYFNEILDCTMASCSVDQFQALLAPAPSRAECRAQRGNGEDGPLQPKSRKRKPHFRGAVALFSWHRGPNSMGLQRQVCGSAALKIGTTASALGHRSTI
ncbi:hypothetical protein PanWU01x14_343970, partial [Parasponia andersonii]